MLVLSLSACATLPEAKHTRYKFPLHGAYVDLPTGEYKEKPYKPLGWVRARAVYSTLENMGEPQGSLCANYYNKAVQDLLREAKKVKAHAVIQIRSVVLLMDGTTEEHKTPECSDDGAEGEILLRGIAIRFDPESGTNTNSGSPGAR